MQELVGVDIIWFILFLVIGMIVLTVVFAIRSFDFYGGYGVSKITLGAVVTLFLSAALGVFFVITVMLPGFTFGLTDYEVLDLAFVFFVFAFLSAMVAGLFSIHVQRGGF
jgi:hypothetical protein